MIKISQQRDHENTNNAGTHADPTEPTNTTGASSIPHVKATCTPLRTRPCHQILFPVDLSCYGKIGFTLPDILCAPAARRRTFLFDLPALDSILVNRSEFNILVSE
jgi:hypothetical protein